MGGRVWGLNSTIISPYLLLDTAHSLPATYWRCVDVITESKHTLAACSHARTHPRTHLRTHTYIHAPLKSFPGATAATLQIMAPMCVQGSKAV